MKEIITLIVAVGAWFVLQTYILPSFGIST
jgi:hypothetical protein